MDSTATTDTSDGIQCAECEGYGTISRFLMICLDCGGTGRVLPLPQPMKLPAMQPEEFL